MQQGYRYSPMGQYFEADPTVKSRRQSVTLSLKGGGQSSKGLSLELFTDRGVFSAGGIDTGTNLLLDAGPSATATDSNLVDLGAGYGPIACALAVRNPQATVWAVEINGRARELCADNAEAHGLNNVRVIEPGEFPDELMVDRIWSNPPIRIGKEALHTMLDLWLARLGPSASAHLVVQKHLGSDSLAKRLGTVGWQVTRRKSAKAYRLLDVTRSES